MKKIEDFFKRIKIEENASANIEVEILIRKKSNMFPNEEEQIMTGAKQLLGTGKFKNIEEAIIFIATNIRGLKFKGIENVNNKAIIEFEEKELNIECEQEEQRI